MKKKIALLKKTKKHFTIQRLFDDWWEGGKWCDENIEILQPPTDYCFGPVSWIRVLLFRAKIFLLKLF